MFGAGGKPFLEPERAERGDVAGMRKALGLDTREPARVSRLKRLAIGGKAAAAADPAGTLQIRRGCRRAHARLVHGVQQTIAASRVSPVVNLVHARIETAHHPFRAAAVRHREQRADADHRHVRTERKALHDAARDAKPGKRAGAFAERDRVEIFNAYAARAQKDRKSTRLNSS